MACDTLTDELEDLVETIVTKLNDCEIEYTSSWIKDFSTMCGDGAGLLGELKSYLDAVIAAGGLIESAEFAVPSGSCPAAIATIRAFKTYVQNITCDDSCELTAPNQPLAATGFYQNYVWRNQVTYWFEDGKPFDAGSYLLEYLGGALGVSNFQPAVPMVFLNANLEQYDHCWVDVVVRNFAGEIQSEPFTTDTYVAQTQAAVESHFAGESVVIEVTVPSQIGIRCRHTPYMCTASGVGGGLGVDYVPLPGIQSPSWRLTPCPNLCVPTRVLDAHYVALDVFAWTRQNDCASSYRLTVKKIADAPRSDVLCRECLDGDFLATGPYVNGYPYSILPLRDSIEGPGLAVPIGTVSTFCGRIDTLMEWEGNGSTFYSVKQVEGGWEDYWVDPSSDALPTVEGEPFCFEVGCEADEPTVSLYDASPAYLYYRDCDLGKLICRGGTGLTITFTPGVNQTAGIRADLTVTYPLYPSGTGSVTWSTTTPPANFNHAFSLPSALFTDCSMVVSVVAKITNRCGQVVEATATKTYRVVPQNCPPNEGNICYAYESGGWAHVNNYTTPSGSGTVAVKVTTCTYGGDVTFKVGSWTLLQGVGAGGGSGCVTTYVPVPRGSTVAVGAVATTGSVPNWSITVVCS